MNDRYLFRGKRLDNGEWVQGHYYNAPNYNVQEAKEVVSHYILDFDLGTDCYDREKLFILSFEIEPGTIGQCTGLKDKNGRLVFAGDVVRCTGKLEWRNETYDETYVNIDLYVYWNKEMLAFFATDDITKKCEGEPFSAVIRYLCKDGNIEIISNVHDNPSLLEGAGA